MRAVVLAAGVGSRLGALTECVPKCLVKVGGMPVLERNLRWLAASGIREVAVNLHHLPERVTAHVGDGSAFGARVYWSYEPELLGTAGTLVSLRDWLAGGTFLVVYGDNLFEVNLSLLGASHRRSGAAATVALFEREDVTASGVAELGASGSVLRFIEKPAPAEMESHLVNAGLLVLEPETLSAMPERGDLSRDVLPGFASLGALHGHLLGSDESLRWIDTPADLEETLACAAAGGPA